MNKSDNINELATALAKAQGAMRFAIKDADNPFFKSKYADLSSVVEAIRDALSGNGLSYMQHLHPSEKHEVCVETVLLHASGQWVSCGTLTVPVSKHDAQGFGSALTYARRYSLSAAVGVVADDDDGNAAAAAAPKAQAPKPQAPKPTTKEVPAKVKEKVAEIQKPARGTVSGDPLEGDLTGIGPDRPASDKVKDKLVAAFVPLGYDLSELQVELGKPRDAWMESDIVDFLQVLDVKRKEQLADIASGQQPKEI